MDDEYHFIIHVHTTKTTVWSLLFRGRFPQFLAQIASYGEAQIGNAVRPFSS